MSLWFCHETGDLRLAYAHEGYLFRDELGPLHLCYSLSPNTPFKTYTYRWIGDFD